MTSRRVRVALWAEDSFVRNVLRLALTSRQISVVVEAAFAAEVCLLCTADTPDVLVVVADAPDELTDTVEAMVGAGIDVLVVAAESSPSVGLDVLASGAAGFVTRDLGMDGLVEAIYDIRSGSCPIDARCAATLVADWRSRGHTHEATSALDELSKREMDVLRLLAAGTSAKGTAAALGVSIKTVENHKTRIFSKLGVRTQAQAALVAVAHGIIGDHPLVPTGDP